jgi:hypothetical protein
MSVEHVSIHIHNSFNILCTQPTGASVNWTPSYREYFFLFNQTNGNVADDIIAA